MEYHPVKVRGRFLYDREFTMGPKSLIIKGAGASEAGGGVLTPGISNTGFYLITPFKLEGREYVRSFRQEKSSYSVLRPCSYSPPVRI